jgi:hypothetical protein
VYPDEIQLRTPYSAQRVLVVRELDGVALRDITSECLLDLEDARKIRLEGGQTLRPVGDGVTALRVRHSASGFDRRVPVRVEGMTDKSPSFVRHVQPVLTRLGCNSGSCHGALAGKGGLKLSLRGYNPQGDHHAMVEDLLGRRSDIIQPDRSLMIRKPLNQVAHGGGKKLRENSLEHEILRRWIAAGAPFSPGEISPASGHKPKNLVLLPMVIRPGNGGKIHPLVMADYPDGSREDVTHWAKFTSTDESVAGVDEEGVVLGIGAGEGYITAWHSDRVAVHRVNLPFSTTGKGPLEQFRPANQIDEWIQVKWNELGLKPAKLCDDEAFLRRLWLDLLGTLPSPAERAEFLAERRPDKRKFWIEKALQSPHYVDFWTHRYGDLFLVRTGRLQQSAVWAFHQELRQAIADNLPWDRVVRRMIAGKGSNLQDGFLNLHVLHRDPATLAEAVAVTFLGQPIGCAKCHNHPQDRWTQDQYWAFANLFGRTVLKPGSVSGEMVVVSSPIGDAPHLRTGLAMPPAPLDGESVPTTSSRDRRELLAEWMLDPSNPFFAKTHVNRIWRHFMGRGLVESDDDMRATNPPSHPELLDHLAQGWIKSGFDNRALIRAVVESATYQRSSIPNPANPDEAKFLTRYTPRRLEAEVLLDAYSQVLDVSTPFTEITPGGGNGSTPYGGYPSGTRAIQLPDTAVVSPFLDTFGRPERLQACSCERLNETSVSQALQMSNGPTLNNKLSAKENLLGRMVQQGGQPAKILDELFLRALGRQPTREESGRFVPLLEQGAQTSPASLRSSLEDVAWAVLSSTEFLVNK